MPVKRNNTQTGAARKTASKKKADPALKLILKRLDTFEQRFDVLEQKIDAVDQKVDTLRQETTAEFKAVRAEVAQGFASFRVEVKADMQKEFEKQGTGIHQHFSRVENELKAEMAELRGNQSRILTGMDASARDYEEYRRDRVLSDGMLYQLRNDVDELKKHDMEKAAAIDKIEKQLKAA